MKQKAILIVVVLVLLVPVTMLLLMSWFAKQPDNLGVSEGRLAPCPNRPNCVCTQSSDPKHPSDPRHRIEPLALTETPEQALSRLKSVLQSRPDVKIVAEDDFYLHAEFTSRVFRFVDDVEFLIDPADRVIHFRSASRTGYSDLGANRRRMEAIRRDFGQAPP